MALADLERLISDGCWEKARAELRRVLEFEALNAAQRCRVLEMSCRIFNRLGQYRETIRFAEQAMALAARLGDPEREFLVRFDLGFAHLCLGNVREAVRAFETFLSGAGTMSGELLGKAWFNVGIARRQLYQWDEAIDAFARATDHYRRTGVVVGEIKALLETAWTYLLADSPYLAEPYVTKAAALVAEWPDSLLEAYLHLVQARLSRMWLDLAESDRLVHDLLQGEHLPEIMAHACWIAGENALDAGDAAEALRLADLALDYTLKCPFPDMVNQAHELLTRARAALDERPWVGA